MAPKSIDSQLSDSLRTLNQAIPIRNPPYHRKKRIRKKWAKKFQQEMAWRVPLAAALIPARRGWDNTHVLAADVWTADMGSSHVSCSESSQCLWVHCPTTIGQKTTKSL